MTDALYQMKLTLPCEMREKRELKKERGGGELQGYGSRGG